MIHSLCICKALRDEEAAAVRSKLEGGKEKHCVAVRSNGV